MYLNYYFITFFLHFELRRLSRPKTTEVCREYAPCPRNTSYIFRLILLKLYRFLIDGLKICMWYFQIPEVIFVTFLHF